MVNRITIWCGSFCVSATTAVLWPELPSLNLVMTLAIGGGVLLFLSKCNFHFHTISGEKQTSWIKFVLIAVSGAFIGATWLASLGYWHLSWQLPQSKIQQDVTINAVVDHGGCLSGQKNAEPSLKNRENALNRENTESTANSSKSKPTQSAGHDESEQRFMAHTVKVNALDDLALRFTRKMTLSHRVTGACLHNGDEFTATVKLKPAYGTLNPVGFNRQQYLASQQIVATGYIKQLHHESVLHNHSTRHNMSVFLSTLPLNQMRWFQALLIGERSLLTKEDWHTIGQTGTAHIFSISGMHLSIIAMTAFYGCSAFIFVASSIVKGKSAFINLRGYVLITLVSSAALYVMLSGMALPVVRAFVLLVVGIGFAAFNNVLRPLHMGVFMLFTCIVLFPLSLLQASFYLSIGAVISIWLLNWRFRFQAMPWYKALFYMQLGVSVVMAPITLLWFGTASTIGIIANLFVLPVITLILPVALLALMAGFYFSPSLDFTVWVLLKIDTVLGWLLSCLSEAASWGISAIHFYPSTGSMLCLLIAMLFVVLPRWRYKWPCVLLLILPVTFSLIPSSPARWFVNVFDAGQGTAIALTKGVHAIIVDTGPMYNGEAPLASKVIPAFLKRNNSEQVDMVIHSHGDTDHAGGKAAFKAWLDNEGIQPSWISPIDGCERGRVINWQGLTLTFLWPEKGNLEDSNAMSCVIKIDDGHHSILLPGDIERSSEYAILHAEQKQMTNGDNAGISSAQDNKSHFEKMAVDADVLIAPHHGSKTSSTDIWIKRVSPDVVVYTQGYENRWKFPSHSVFSRYQHYGVRQFTTSEFGFIRLEFAEGGYIVSSERKDAQNRWYLPRYTPRHLISSESEVKKTDIFQAKHRVD
ncbi:DNA internalization-related competence protein ComEC/Rec2 [Alteromonas sp. R78001]|uniref:DNA internalization-related competence protein ComEC/Rec2 n=1 Tax=Alteromonas sp. R78001 TaxID=3093865 RepID=UPI00366B8EAB